MEAVTTCSVATFSLPTLQVWAETSGVNKFLHCGWYLGLKHGTDDTDSCIVVVVNFLFDNQIGFTRLVGS